VKIKYYKLKKLLCAFLIVIIWKKWVGNANITTNVTKEHVSGSTSNILLKYQPDTNLQLYPVYTFIDWMIVGCFTTSRKYFIWVIDKFTTTFSLFDKYDQ
jgi:hypothetical protein